MKSLYIYVAMHCLEGNVNTQLVMNSFGTLFHDKIFSLTFPDMFQIPLHFQVFQTSAHPAH